MASNGDATTSWDIQIGLRPSMPQPLKSPQSQQLQSSTISGQTTQPYSFSGVELAMVLEKKEILLEATNCTWMMAWAAPSE